MQSKVETLVRKNSVGDSFCTLCEEIWKIYKCMPPPALIAVNKIDKTFYMKHIEEFKKQLQISVESTGSWLLVDDKMLPFIGIVFNKDLHRRTPDKEPSTGPEMIRAKFLREGICVVSSTDRIVREIEDYVAENKCLIYETEYKIPMIKVVVGGGMDQVDCLNKRLNKSKQKDSGVHWVVVKGSGLAADYISKMTAAIRNQDGNIKEEVIKNAFKTHFENNEVPETFFDVTPFQSNKILVYSFGQEDTSFEEIIQNAMFDALKDIPDLHYLINLLIKWNRIDIFEDEIFTFRFQRDDSHTDILLDLFKSSFERGSKEFLNILVDFLVDEISHKYFHSEETEKLYKTCLGLDTKGNAGKIILAIKNVNMEQDLTTTNEVYEISVTMEQDRWIRFYNNYNKVNNAQKRKCCGSSVDPDEISLDDIRTIIHDFCGDDQLKVLTDDKKDEKSKEITQTEQDEEVMFRLFVCCILTNQKEIAMIFWKRCKNNIFAALFASNILGKMARLASKQHLLELHQSCSENARFFEDLSTRVITELFEYKSADALELLVTEVERYNATPLEFANRCRLMRFVAATPCQVKLETMWMGDIEPQTSPSKVLVGVLFPVLIIFNVGFIHLQLPKKSKKYKAVQNDDTECKPYNPFKATWNFYKSPISTFFIHTIFYIAFLTNFALFMLSDLYPVSEKEPSANEYVTWVLVLSLIIEEISQVFIHGEMKMKYRIEAWSNSLWNVFDLMSFVVFAVAVVLRFVLESEDFFYARFAYSISLGVFILRTLQLFYISRHIGPKVVMLEKLIADIIFFFSLFAVFVFTFGIVYQVILYPNSEPSWQLFKDIIFLPYFSLYGELNMEIVTGLEPSACTDDIEAYKNGTLPRCPKSSAFNTFMLAVYLILTNILLLNTLIAMFSFTIQNVHQNSEIFWKYNRYTLIREYYERPMFPVPIIIHIWRFVRWCLFTIFDIHQKDLFCLEANKNYDVSESKAVELYFFNPTKARSWYAMKDSLVGDMDIEGPIEGPRQQSYRIDDMRNEMNQKLESLQKKMEVDMKSLQNQLKQHYNILVDKILANIKSQQSVVLVHSGGMGSSQIVKTVLPRPDHDQDSS